MNKTHFIDHHWSHASSSYRCSGFDEVIILTVDGEGDSVSTSIFYGKDGVITRLIAYPASQSIGHLYSKMTRTLGLGDFGAEGKAMGLSNYGEVDPEILSLNLLEKTPLGYRVKDNADRDLAYYRCFSGELTQKHKNLAATIQYQLEEVMVHLVKMAYDQVKSSKVCLAGGVALNCLTNSKIRDLDFVEDVFVQPAANDGGTALGAALEVMALYSEHKVLKLGNAYYGQDYSNEEIKQVLDSFKLKYEWVDDPCDVASDALCDQKIIGGQFRELIRLVLEGYQLEQIGNMFILRPVKMNL